MEQDFSAMTVVVIPSLEPTDRLVAYVRQLRAYRLSNLVIVDDGSGPAYQQIFDALVAEGCTVLHHDTNLGKGAALKTAFTHIATHFPYATTIVTADSDGQHAVHDVARVAAESADHPDAVVLGERHFAVSDVPRKSRLGNTFSNSAFALLYGQRLGDTQTGLRAFGAQHLTTMLAIGGTRFEYEINMLVACARGGIPLRSVSIEAIYEGNNAGTHFRPLKDSLRVIGTLISGLIRFSASSLAGAAVDLGVAWLLFDWLRPFFSADAAYQRILVASAVARAASIAVNYLLNRRFVFHDREAPSHSLVRYLALSALLIVLSASGVFALSTFAGVNEKIAKPICDVLLFFLSYRVQQSWVFTTRNTQVGASRP